MPNRMPVEPRPDTGIYAHVVGWGMAVPDKVMTNEDMAAFVDTSDEWIRARTGIRERHIASDRESTATLGLKAAQAALEVANILPAQLDMIIVATSTPENIFPGTANLIQAWLGARNSGAFDLSAACAGFVYALSMGAQAIRSGGTRTVLVIGSETMSRVIDWQDRGTCILFGDGAGAVVLEASTTPGGVLSTVMRSDGSGGDLLGIPSVGTMDSSFANGHKMHKMHMNGGEVFKFGTRVIGESVTQALTDAGLTVDDLRLIIPHQANMRIIQAAARALKVDESLFVTNLDRYGNTSAASIPIALCEAVQQGRIKPTDHIAVVGFGGGLSWASAVIKWGVPKLEDRQQVFIKRQQRQFTYTRAWWRTRGTWFLRRLRTFILEFTQPGKARIERLRRKVEDRDLE